MHRTRGGVEALNMGKVMSYETVNHKLEYVRGDMQTHRSTCGTFRHVGDGFLPTYLSEIDIRHSRRKMSDADRSAQLMSQVGGKHLPWFCQTP